ncbi:hypothetical protein [Halalkalibacter alkalisediminis]|uniref:Sporulation histidine kinase inhibitor Sda n=1 Tax=Halalkalibacter alkalisediminis TaxID=935616 RepID=A0ABV6NFM0_9BACI|nr:hypothetical protein [Halalkalibacter alkalisediminis]
MDFIPHSSSFLTLSNEEFVELYNLVLTIQEIDSEFIVLLEEELARRELVIEKQPINQ